MIKTEEVEKIEILTSHQLRDWLEKNYDRKIGVWLVTYKKATGHKYVSRWDVLDELLCFGWVDGIRKKVDDLRTMQYISPRKVEHWAKTYKDRVAVLINEDRMHISGIKSVQRSKDNGLWHFMDDVDNLILPDDLSKVLKKNANALQFFESINASSKRFALRWLKLAKTEKTRKGRIEKIASLSAKGEKLLGS